MGTGETSVTDGFLCELIITKSPGDIVPLAGKDPSLKRKGTIFIPDKKDHPATPVPPHNDQLS